MKRGFSTVGMILFIGCALLGILQGIVIFLMQRFGADAIVATISIINILLYFLTMLACVALAIGFFGRDTLTAIAAMAGALLFLVNLILYGVMWALSFVTGSGGRVDFLVGTAVSILGALPIMALAILLGRKLGMAWRIISYALAGLTLFSAIGSIAFTVYLSMLGGTDFGRIIAMFSGVNNVLSFLCDVTTIVFFTGCLLSERQRETRQTLPGSP